MTPNDSICPLSKSTLIILENIYNQAEEEWLEDETDEELVIEIEENMDIFDFEPFEYQPGGVEDISSLSGSISDNEDDLHYPLIFQWQVDAYADAYAPLDSEDANSESDE